MKAYQSIALAATLLFASLAARAGMSDCEELKAPGLASQRDKCVAFAPCDFVLSTKPDCAAARLFLERTQGNVLNRLAGVLKGSKPMTANDVYDANLPDIEYSQDWKDRFAAVREKAAAAGTETETAKSSAGVSVLYLGDMKDGKRQGWGFMFFSDGYMYRGQYADGWRTGMGESATRDGYRDVGMRQNNLLEGDAFQRTKEGVQRKGNFSKGKLEGAGTYLYPNGQSYVGNFANNAFHGAGIFRWPDGRVLEGNFVNGKAEGQHNYTNAAGEKLVRTYAGGEVVAGGTPGGAVAAAAVAAAPVNPIAACKTRHDTCTTACSVASLIGALARSGNSAGAQKCIDACENDQNQCMANAAPAPSREVAGASTPDGAMTGARAPASSSAARAPSNGPAVGPGSGGNIGRLDNSSGNTWPSDVEPGNMYLIEYVDYPGYESPARVLMVSAKTRAEALALVQQKWAEKRSEALTSTLRNYSAQERAKVLQQFDNTAFTVGMECVGPNWAAVVTFYDGAQRVMRWGAICGARLPADAIVAAAEGCRRNGGDCGAALSKHPDSRLAVDVGHSGAKPSKIPAFCSFGGSCWPGDLVQFAALWATTRQFSHSFVQTQTVKGAIESLDQPCRAERRDTHSCWVTAKNFECIRDIRSDPADGLQNEHKCVDRKLPSGYK